MLGFGGLFMGLLCLIFFVALILWIVRMVTWRRHGMGCRMHGMYGMYGMHDDHGPMHGMETKPWLSSGRGLPEAISPRKSTKSD